MKIDKPNPLKMSSTPEEMEPLHQIVDRISTGYLPEAQLNYNFFINEIPRDLSVEHNSEYVSSVISGMISTAINSTKDCCIRFSAKKFGHVLVLELREVVRTHMHPDHSQLKQIQNLAEMLGGCLYVGSREEERILMSFSFPNLPVAA